MCRVRGYVVAAVLVVVLAGCGKQEEATAPELAQEGPAAVGVSGGSAGVPQPAPVVAVAGIDFPLALTERSREERPAAGGARGMVVRFDSEGESEKVGAVIKKSLSKAGYRISESVESDGSVKYVGRSDQRRIAAVVYPTNAETGKGMVSFFWQE